MVGSKVCVEEGVRDGVIWASGDGQNKENIRKVKVHVDDSLDKESHGNENKENDDNDDSEDNDSDGDGDNDSDDVNDEDDDYEQNDDEDNDDNDELYYLKEHRVGDTGPLPMDVLREEFSNASSGIIHINYSY
jgi:hypothetical protein